jgi:UDP-N-acetyl-D-mannosaminuronic acid dehydrogenase
MANSDSNIKSDICVVGGAGHVGLPLALLLAHSAGKRVCILDLNQQSLNTIQSGTMPFMEAGGQELLTQCLKDDRLLFSSDPTAIQHAEVIIVTIGTPVDEFYNPNLKGIKAWLTASVPYLASHQLIVLRSTLYPGTTRLLSRMLQEAGKTIDVAFCPERIVQGKAIKELTELPQIISGNSERAVERAAQLFELMAPQTVRMTTLEAEMAKLFTNAYRYIQFAAANQFYMIANNAGVDYNAILDKLKHNYSRARDIPRSGFAAGPCLLKDTMQLAAFSQNQFALGHASMTINEGLILYIADSIARKYPLQNETIGLLGMAFKADNDDIRSALSYKLKKILEFRASNVLTTDPHVTNDPTLLPLETVIEKSDRLILCVPHSAYKDIDLKGKALVDIWNFFGNGSTI